MLATQPSTPTGPTYHQSHTHTFLPLIPSPLSPRRYNFTHANHHFTTSTSTPRTLPSPLSYNFVSTTPISMASDHQHSRETPAAPRTTPMGSTSIGTTSTRTGVQGGIPFSQRAIKTAPTTTTTRPDALRERRRDIFLKKVKKERDERRWGGRVEDMAHLDYRLEKTRWEAEQLRSAPLIPSDPIEEDEDWFGTSSNHNASFTTSSQMQGSQVWPRDTGAQAGHQGQEDWEADALLAQEESELEAMIAMMQDQEMEHGGDQETNTVDTREGGMEEEGGGDVQAQTPYASDDDEYDSIFLDLIDHQAGQEAVGGAQQEGEADDMDMS